jgi:HAE1 family hydrophobic/amphiphilic exporter-1
MSLAETSIKRPIFISSIIVMIIVVGLLSMSRLPVDLFPNVTFPVVTVTTAYPGSGPSEVETLVSKPLEEELSTLSGIKRLSSISQEGVSTVIAEFTLETDVKYAEQQVRDRAGATKRKLPLDILEPVIRRIDPADQPILVLALEADLSESQLFDLADEVIKPSLEQVNQVGLVEILGGRKRELQVQLDRQKLKAFEISATAVAGRVKSAGENIPIGKVDQKSKNEVVFRTVSEFKKLEDIKSVVLTFFGNDVPTTVGDVGVVVDTLVDETNRTFLNGKKSLFIYAYKQSGSNTVAVVDALKAKVAKLNTELSSRTGKGSLTAVRDGSKWIRSNIADVKESILIGIVLAIVVVFFFLANARSTVITSLALPNSLIGAFILMAAFGFSINIMTLLALSLSVGLLVDDAIVVRENIFRHIEMGKSPLRAALDGTNQVTLAVIATTLAVIAVFGPVGFLKGVTGQFFKEFGLTICFALAISLFDALTVAPMLSAYLAGKNDHKERTGFWKMMWAPVAGFSRFQDWLENVYERVLHFTVRRPGFVIVCSLFIFFALMYTAKYIPKTFLPTQDAGEFAMAIDLPPGASLEQMAATAKEVDDVLRSNAEVAVSALTVGKQGEANTAEFYVALVPRKERKLNTSQFKQKLRDQLKPFARLNPQVKDYDAVGGGQRPFNVNIIGTDFVELERVGLDMLARMKQYPALKDVDINFRPGKPEFQVVLDKGRAERLGVSSTLMGQELRTQVEGVKAAKFRENGREYDIRVRLNEQQRDLKQGFSAAFVPNINQNLVRLTDVAKPQETVGPTKINRQDRARYVQISGDITPGAGLDQIMKDVSSMLDNDAKMTPGMRYAFVGQAENFKELGESMMIAMGLGIIFIFFVLASLYESVVTPFTIMLALPLAICGSMLALFLANESLNIFSMIGVIMLLGVATKNSILVVDYANQLVKEGMGLNEAIIKAGRTRLRPILMTTMALIAGTIPIAIGLNEASKQRTSMGVAIIGGLISSTLLTLVVVPAAYSFLERFRMWSLNLMTRIFVSRDASDEASIVTDAKPANKNIAGLEH